VAGIVKYSTTPGSNNAAAPDGFPENMRPSEVNNSARQVMADIRTWYEDAEWLRLGENGNTNAFSISYVSATVFKFTNTDRRTLVPVNRRVKAGVGAGTVYGTVTDSSLSASDTQITVAWDSGTLDTSLSYIALGIISPTNNSLPRNLDQSFSDIAVVGQASLSDVHVAGRLNSAYAARAWGFVTFAAGTPTLASSLGVSGISDVAQGRTQIKLSISMSTSSYPVISMQEGGSSPIVSDRTKNDFILNIRDMSLSATDVNFSFTVFGAQ
jgi:hypothetical protein